MAYNSIVHTLPFSCVFCDLRNSGQSLLLNFISSTDYRVLLTITHTSISGRGTTRVRSGGRGNRCS